MNGLIAHVCVYVCVLCVVCLHTQTDVDTRRHKWTQVDTSRHTQNTRTQNTLRLPQVALTQCEFV